MMRALGRGSVSSLLKAVLDVFYIALLAAAAASGLLAVIVLLFSFRPDLIESELHIESLRFAGSLVGPILAAALIGFDIYLAGAVVIVGRLRRIFRSLIDGDPFHPDNVRRLNVIAAALATLEVGRYLAALVSRLFLHGALPVHGGVNLSSWFSILVIVVLAEVFREGARLRGEAELTI